MAATTVFHSTWNSDTGFPANQSPSTSPFAPTHKLETYTVATTSLDDVGDRIVMNEIPLGRGVIKLRGEWSEDGGGGGGLDTNGTPTLTADIVLSDRDDTDNDQILHSLSTSDLGTDGSFNVLLPTKPSITSSPVGTAALEFEVTAAAATASAGTLTLYAEWE